MVCNLGFTAMNMSCLHKVFFLSQFLLSIVSVSCLIETLKQNLGGDPSLFPSNFLFGTASSSYQVLPPSYAPLFTFCFLKSVSWLSCRPNYSKHTPFLWVRFLLHILQFEGAFLNDGKGLNNWDVFSHEPGVLFCLHTIYINYAIFFPHFWRTKRHMDSCR